jgi:hypothetical protein
MSTPNPLLDVECAAFPTLDQIKETLGIADASKDAALSALMKGTLTMIEGYLGRGIVERERTERIDPIDTRDSKLFLSLFPISEVASIVVDGGAPLLSGWRVFKAQGIVELPHGCCRSGPRHCCGNEPQIEVTYTGGYPQDCWPPSLLDAVMSTFYRRWNATSGDASQIVTGGAVKSWAADGLSISMGDVSAGLGSISTDAIPPDLLPVAAQLDPYRLRFVRGV